MVCCLLREAQVVQTYRMDLLAVAPVRTADVGGWSDTWFARTGVVCSVGVLPGVTVRLVDADLAAGKVEVEARDLGLAGTVDAHDEATGVDPLLDAAIRSIPLPFGARCIIESGVPAGSGLGTSAAVVVALLSVLRAAAGIAGEAVQPGQLARDAHRIETGLGQQSGVQDQLAAAFGGVNRFRIDYPSMTGIDSLPYLDMAELLQGRLLTVYLGAPHQSSKLHEQVIASLPGRDTEVLLTPMVQAAQAAFDALSRNNLRAYGSSLIENHEAIRELHPELISALADQVVELARSSGALGWKVNGAGGSGGTIALLFAEPGTADQFSDALGQLDACRLLPTTVSSGGVMVIDNELQA